MTDWPFWVVLAWAALATSQWWAWRRVAFATRDAAFESFAAIRDTVTKEAGL